MPPEPKSRNIQYHDRLIDQAQREERNRHRGAVLWLTGLSGSGKSTLSTMLERALFQRGCQTFVLDGDNVRHGLNRDLGFSPEDRTENIRRIGEVAILMREAGLIALTAFISPYRADRDKVRARVPKGQFIEIYVDCPLEVCEERDPKGLYQKARKGEISEFTGISAPYEAPTAPEVTIHTDQQTPEASIEYLIAELQRLQIIP